MDVAAWLRSSGLSQYEAAFRKNAIDVDVLPDLTDGDLTELSVNLGDRKRLLKAIARLSSAETPEWSPEDPSSSKDDAERRPITVMFCDLVGSTTIAAKLDAEDWRDLVGAYLDAASAAVTELGGHVLNKLGDGLMALFGYPQAQENDAERAVRAALAIQRALDDLNATNADKDAPRLAARIGLESGRSWSTRLATSLATRPISRRACKRLAEPGSVSSPRACNGRSPGCSSPRTVALHELKGVPAPVTLYRSSARAAAAGGAAARADAARRTRGGTRTTRSALGACAVGRGPVRPRRRRARHRQVAADRGVPRSARRDASHWVEWSSSQLLQNTPLHPIVEWGRLRFGGADAPAERRLADLESALRSVGLDPAEYAPLLAPLLEGPPAEQRRVELAPEELRRRQLAAMTAWILAGARSQPARAGLRGFALGRSDLARSHERAGRARRCRRRC